MSRELLERLWELWTGLEVCVEGEGSSQVSARLARLGGESS